MGTALIYLLVVVAVAAAVFGLAAAVFGRDDVRALRFPQAVRGYRMAEVDWVLDRLATELDRAGTERERLRARVAELEAHHTTTTTKDGPR